MIDTHLIALPRLQAATRLLVQAFGSSAAEVDAVVGNLIDANLTGHDSHGIGMLPRYADAHLEGSLKVNAHVSTVQGGGALLRLDGNAGFGQVICTEAMALAFLDWVRASPARAGYGPVQVAGDAERASRAQPTAQGVPVDDTIWQEILDAAAKLGVAPAALNAAAGLG